MLIYFSTEVKLFSLKKISKEFGFSVVNLFLNGNNLNSSWEYRNPAQMAQDKRGAYVESVEVVRSDKRKRLALPGSQVIYDLLTPDMNRQMEVMFMRVQKGDNSGEEPMLDPPGEKIGIVLNGTLEMRIGQEVYKLQEGDSIYYPTNIPHSWRALEGDPIEVIWILTPPSF